MIRNVLVATTIVMATICGASQSAITQDYDLVIRAGRVMDPESRLDAVCNVGIEDGVITAISAADLSGREVIDATGLVVAPGFIDLHQHSWDEESIRLKAQDGVTSILELEIGTADVDGWYRERDGKTLLHHGVSIGHIPVRMEVMGDPSAFLPPAGARAISEVATAKQIQAMAEKIAQGLDAGAVAVGFGIAYTPAASEKEIVAMFRVAASRNASCHLHMRGRGQGGGGPASAIETARLAAIAAAPLHFVHYQAGAKTTIHELLRLVEGWQAAGQDVTGEVYPWTAGMTEIQSALFAEGFQDRLGVTYSDMQWGATGERLTEESFRRYRKEGGLVIVHNNTEAAVTMAVNHPLMMIASDGLKGHPRNAGTYARVLGHYVREGDGLELMQAIGKMSLMPAKRLEGLTKSMQRKGRIQVGCDADLTLFDPQTVDARATYEEPFLPSKGISWVVVAGTPIVRNGELIDDLRPGLAIRAAH